MYELISILAKLGHSQIIWRSEVCSTALAVSGFERIASGPSAAEVGHACSHLRDAPFRAQTGSQKKPEKIPVRCPGPST